MKNFLLTLVATFVSVCSTQAALLTYTDSKNVSTDGENFTFTQFNPAFGSLTAIDLIIQTSTIQGNLTLTRTSVSGTRTYTDLNAGLSIDPAPGFSGYDTTAYSYLRTPSGNFTINTANTSRFFSVNGTTQSLISGSPITLNINPANFASYTGLSTISFTSYLLTGDINTGSGTVSTDASNLIAPTTLALRYTYSTPDPSPVPEPGQVAASLLLLGSFGVYYIVKRRQMAKATT